MHAPVTRTASCPTLGLQTGHPHPRAPASRGPPAPRHLCPGPRAQLALRRGTEMPDLASTAPSQMLTEASVLARLKSSLAGGEGTGCPLSWIFCRRRHRRVLCVGDLVVVELGGFPGSRPCLTGDQGPEWEGRTAYGRHALGHGRGPSPPPMGDSPGLLAAILGGGLPRCLHGGGPSATHVTPGGALRAAPSRVLRASPWCHPARAEPQ